MDSELGDDLDIRRSFIAPLLSSLTINESLFGRPRRGSAIRRSGSEQSCSSAGRPIQETPIDRSVSVGSLGLIREPFSPWGVDGTNSSGCPPSPQMILNWMRQNNNEDGMDALSLSGEQLGPDEAADHATTRSRVLSSTNNRCLRRSSSEMRDRRASYTPDSPWHRSQRSSWGDRRSICSSPMSRFSQPNFFPFVPYRAPSVEPTPPRLDEFSSFFTPQGGRPAERRLVRRDRPFFQSSGRMYMHRRSSEFNGLARRDWFHVVLGLPTKVSFFAFFVVYTLAVMSFAVVYLIADAPGCKITHEDER